MKITLAAIAALAFISTAAAQQPPAYQAQCDRQVPPIVGCPIAVAPATTPKAYEQWGNGSKAVAPPPASLFDHQFQRPMMR